LVFPLREILTLSKKLPLEDRDWADLLRKCALDHEANKKKQRSKGGDVVDHPGFLFRHELKRRLRQYEEQRANGDREPMGADEMYAIQKLTALAGSPDWMIDELRRIIRTQVVFDDDGTPLPCQLSWDDVEADLARSGGKFKNFERLIAKRLYRTPNEPLNGNQSPKQAELDVPPPKPKRIDEYLGDLREFVCVSLVKASRLENAVRTECLKHGSQVRRHYEIILEALNRLEAASRKLEEGEFCEAVDAVLVEQGMAPVFKAKEVAVEVKPESTLPEDILDALRRMG
jgi:hypothetical protein